MEFVNIKTYIDTLNDQDLKKILNLLNQLSITFTDEEELEVMIKSFKDEIKQFNSTIYIVKVNNNIIGLGTILIEKKIIHNFGKIAHIEDIVIDKEERGNGYGKKLIKFLISKAQELNCYKVILNCKNELVEFYKSCVPYNCKVFTGNQVSYYL